MDEIGELSEKIQKKLLKVIEEGTFFRVGGTQELKSFPKLIFATNQNLEQMVAEKKFRRDFYMRISGFPITMPSLSERKEDIPDIIKALLPRCCAQNHVKADFKDIPKDFIEYLTETPFEGNIRALEHHIDRLLVLSPKDKSGQPVFSQWKTIPGLYSAVNRNGAAQKNRDQAPLTSEEILSRPMEVLGPQFPGLSEFLEKIGDKVIAEAATKFAKNSERARALKLAESSTYARVRKLSDRGTISDGSSEGSRASEVLQ